jgi:UDP-glucose 4-epimerase
MGTAEVCEYARKHGSRIVYAGSSSAYGGVMLNPYAFAKRSGEEICELYSKVYNTSTVVARFFNVYGDRHPVTGPYATVVGIFEQKMLKGEPMTIIGDGEQRRDFTHVSDIVSGLIALGEKSWKSEIFNLGCEERLHL